MYKEDLLWLLFHSRSRYATDKASSFQMGDHRIYKFLLLIHRAGQPLYNLVDMVRMTFPVSFSTPHFFLKDHVQSEDFKHPKFGELSCNVMRYMIH